jgi:hypothetical protein
MRKFGIVMAAISVAALFVLPNAVHAGIQNQMEAVPNSGSPGDSFVVHNLEGSPCFGNEVVVTIDGPAPFGEESETDQFFKGDWEVEFTVPMGSTPGPYLVNATCNTGKGSFNYAPVTYTVLGQQSQEPSPSPDPSPSPSPSPSESPDVGPGYEEAPAAQPEVEAAAFTG